MKKLLGLMLCFLCVCLVGCKKVSWNESKGELVIGLECDYAPFNWTETEKSDTNVEIYGQKGLYAEGYDIQMAKLLAEELGVKLVVKKMDWDGLIPALTSGDIDAIIAGMSPTEERKETINFTNEYYRSEHVVIVKDGSGLETATKFSDFAGKNICGQKGTAYDKLAEQLATKGNGNYQTALKSVPLIVSAIMMGATDATIVEKPVALGVCSNNPSLTYVKLADEFELAEEDRIVSIGVRKVDTVLQDKLNAALGKISVTQREALMASAVANAPASEE